MLLTYPQRGTGSSDVGGLGIQRWGWTSRGGVVVSESSTWAMIEALFLFIVSLGIAFTFFF